MVSEKTMTLDKGTGMDLPNFVCIGVQKGGTTWLYTMLSQNPSIWLPPVKEIHYFDRLERGGKINRRGINKKIAMLTKKTQGKSAASDALTESRLSKIEKYQYLRDSLVEDEISDDWYRGMFSDPARAGRISGDITPAYFQMKSDTIANMKVLLPNAKILLIIRDPLSRDVSQIKMEASRSKMQLQSDDQWKDFVSNHMQDRWRGDYATQLPIWQNQFTPDQLLIVPFGHIKHDPAGLMKRIETFIGAEAFDGYNALSEAVHVAKKEIQVPDWLIEQLGARSAPQAEYLIETFGDEFYRSTK